MCLGTAFSHSSLSPPSIIHNLHISQTEKERVKDEKGQKNSRNVIHFLYRNSYDEASSIHFVSGPLSHIPKHHSFPLQSPKIPFNVLKKYPKNNFKRLTWVRHLRLESARQIIQIYCKFVSVSINKGSNPRELAADLVCKKKQFTFVWPNINMQTKRTILDFDILNIMWSCSVLLLSIQIIVTCDYKKVFWNLANFYLVGTLTSLKQKKWACGRQ